MNVDAEHMQRMLQASISPVALISGVGLLILSMTNRFGRVTDRLREMSENSPANDSRRQAQVAIFLKRARLLKNSISCAVGSVLGASVMILLLFLAAVLAAPVRALVLVLFAVSLLLLIFSLVYFLLDMNLSLRAVEEHLGPRGG